MRLHRITSSLAASRSRWWAERDAIVAVAGDWLLDRVVLGFALWTACCHLTVASNGTGVQLWWTAAIAFAGVSIGLWWRARRARRARDAVSTTTTTTTTTTSTATTTTSTATTTTSTLVPAATRISIVGLLGVGAVLWVWRSGSDPFYFWTNGLAFLLFSSVLLLWRPVVLEPYAPDPGSEARAHRSSWLLAWLAAAATACMRLPNTDDVLYVNIGATFADHPERVLYAGDSLHGEGMGQLAAYGAHSYELLAGALSRLTHIPTLHLMHLLFAPFAGLLTVLALGKLFRLIEPRRWLWLVAIVVSWYLFDGTTERSVAGHAFMRMFQGKSVLLSVGVPLIAAYAIGYALTPSRRAWLLLACSLIAGIGLSSTGLWLALLVAFTGLFVPCTWRWRYWRGLGWGLCSLIYPIAFALFMRAQVVSAGASTSWEMPKTMDAAAQEAVGLRPELNSFGTPLLAHVYLTCIVLAWPLARTALARRYLVAYSLGGFAVLLNPYLTGLVASNLTGTAVYSRVLWYMPFAAAFACCFAFAVPSRPGKISTVFAAIITFGALAYFYQYYPRRSTLALLEFPPALKVEPDAYKVASYVARKLPDDDLHARVLAPYEIALVLPTLQHSPYLVITKAKFFDDQGARYRLMRMVERKGSPLRGRYRGYFIALLEMYDVCGVVLNPDAALTDGMAASLSAGGFTQARTVAGYQVWLRGPWPR